MKKSIRFYIALWISKAAMLLQRLLGMNASYFPGKIAIKLCPDFLGRVDKPETVITVTGTNGKTTCCNLILDILTDNGLEVLNNKAGSNIDAGIASSLIADVSIFGRTKKKLALFEVDERSSFRVYKYIHPSYTVCTNLFRDSITRNAHPEFIFDIINKALPDDTQMILNADDPISSNLKSCNPRVFFSMPRMDSDRDACENLINDMRICPICRSPIEYEWVRYHHIGKMHCTGCDFASHEPDFSGTPDDDSRVLTVTDRLGSEQYPIIGSGKFNCYNELAVITLLRTMGFSAEKLRSSLGSVEIVKSRYNSKKANGIEVIANMTKGQNPVACSIVFDFIRSQSCNKEVILVLTDTSFKGSTELVNWLYDSDYEFLREDSVKRIIVGGARREDYKLRLLLAGIPEERIRLAENELDTPELLELEETDKIFILHDLTTPVMTQKVLDGCIAEIEKRGVQR